MFWHRCSKKYFYEVNFVKAMKLLAVVLTICMAFSCIAVIPFTAATVASADATPIGVTTNAIYVGPSQRGYSQVPSGVIFPLVYDGSYGPNSVIKLTFDVKMLAGTKPYVEIFNYTKNRNAGSGSSAYVTNCATYIGMCNNASSSITNGVYTTTINVGSNLDTNKLWYYDTEDGQKQVRISTAAAAATSAPAANQVPVWGVIRIGNVNYGDEGEPYYSDGNSAAGFNSEFLIKNVKMQLTTVANGNGTKSNGDYISVPAVSSFDSGKVYGVTGTYAEGGLNNSKNHPANAKKNMWSICSPDEDTVRLVTVPNDAFSSASHSYTYHAETDYEYGYYTCADFGDVKFDKVGNCYFKSETKKQSVIIKDRAGDVTAITDRNTDADIVYSNIFIPVNTHKWFSAYGQNGAASNRIKESSSIVRMRVTFTAKRLSGSGQPIIGRMYSNAGGGSLDAANMSGNDIKTGAPMSNPVRAWNNNTGIAETDKNPAQAGYLASSYNASTGAFTADIGVGTGDYNYLTRTGINTYITIGIAEHGYGAKRFDSYCADGSFIISDIKMYVYTIGDDNTMMFGGADVAPKMIKSNFDTTTPYMYFGDNATNEYLNSTKNSRNCGMRHAPLGKYSAEGCIQNITLTDKKICTVSNCSLTHHASTDTTCEYWSCSTHGKYFDDKYASNEIDNISANKKMIVVKQSGSNITGTVIPFDNDGWNGSAKTFIFKCKMKVFGDNIPNITRFQGSYYGGIGGMVTDGATDNTKTKDGSNTLWIDYDPETCIYTAAFTMFRPNFAGGGANDKNYFRYVDSNTGAHTAIMLGNSKPLGAGTQDMKNSMGFAFSDPQVYEAVDAAAGTYTGSNLCPQINDKTLNFSNNYPYSNFTTINGEAAARGDNSPMAAPLNKWSKYGGAPSYITSSDIPAGFFSNDNTSRMLSVSGRTTATNTFGNNTVEAYDAISKQLFIAASTTYKFEFDYRAYGGQLHLRPQWKNNSGSYTTITPLEEAEEGEPHFAADHVDGAHYSIIFTTPDDLPTTGDGNFRFYIGQQVDYHTKKSASIYLSNFNLVAIDDGGDKIDNSHNAFMNGGFYFGNANTEITEANIGTNLFGWDLEYATSTSKPAILSFYSKQLLDITDNFFDEDYYGYTADGQGDDDLAYWFPGGQHQNIRFDFNLPTENANYELSWNYRCEDDDVEGVSLQGTGGATLTPEVTTVENGKFRRRYTISTTTDHTQWTNDANTRILINIGSYSQGRGYYIANLSLRKKAGSTLVGPNLIADANPIFDSSYYPVTTNNFTIPADNNETTGAILGHRWSAAREEVQGSICAVKKVSNTFFNHYTTSERLTYMTNLLLNKSVGYNPYEDNQNPYYAPINGSSMTILDLIKIKKDACTADDEGGAGVEANALLNAINKETNKFEATGSTVTITSSTTSVASAVNGKDTIYIDKTTSGANVLNAINNAKGGATILLQRGGEWRVPKNVSTAAAITLKNNQKLGTYGTGPKPVILGSGDNYGGSSHTSYWTEVSTNIWKVKVHGGAEANTYMMPGLVYFFTDYNGEPAFAGNHDKNAKDAGINAMNFNAFSELTEEGDVYFPASSADFKASNGNNGYLYVYCSQNPATKYPRIEIGLKRTVIDVASGCSIDGIGIKYAGGLGMGASAKTNVSITNCEIGYIGGSPNSSGTNTEYCFGNGIQFGQGGSNLTIDHCYVYHCFDAGITFQSYNGVDTTFDGVNFTNNLLVNNFYNIEFFTTGDSAHKSSGSSSEPNGNIRNVLIKGNIMRFAGETYSWNQRADIYRCGNIAATQDAWYVNTSNLVIRDNIFDCTMVSQFMWTWGGIDASITGGAASHVGTTITNNSYFQKAGSLTGYVGHFGNISGSTYDFAGGTTKLEQAVANIEANPARVRWVNRADKY